MQVNYYWSITLTKLSVALLLLRLKPGRYWKLFLRGVIALLLTTVLTQTLFQFLQCQPFSIYWDPSVFFRNGGVTCIPRSFINGNIIANSTVHVTTDLVFSFIPITFIHKLRRPRNEKIFLSILMGLGLFASTFAILRTVGLASFYMQQDYFRTNTMPVLWASLEQEVALVAATMPTLKSFVQRALVGIGRWFYEEESESQIRGRLVVMGFLDGDADGSRVGRKPSKPDVGDEVVTFGSPRRVGRRDEFGDTVMGKEVGVEVEMRRFDASGKWGDVGLERVGVGRWKEYEI